MGLPISPDPGLFFLSGGSSSVFSHIFVFFTDLPLFSLSQICLYFLENSRSLFCSDHRAGAFELSEKIIVFKTRHDVEVQVVDDLASGGPAVVKHIYCVAVCGLKSQNSS